MRYDSLQYDVVVVGGGASGMMAAGVAASRGKKVLLIEKNKSLGEKFRPCPLLVQYVKAGRLGRKSGKGVYEYPN